MHHTTGRHGPGRWRVAGPLCFGSRSRSYSPAARKRPMRAPRRRITSVRRSRRPSTGAPEPGFPAGEGDWRVRQCPAMSCICRGKVQPVGLEKAPSVDLVCLLSASSARRDLALGLCARASTRPSSKRAGRGSPPLGRFDSFAASLAGIGSFSWAFVPKLGLSPGAGSRR